MSKYELINNEDGDDKVQKVPIKDAMSNQFIFYVTQGGDLLILARTNNHVIRWGFYSTWQMFDNLVLNCAASASATFENSTKTKSIKAAMSTGRGRTVYATNSASEMIELHSTIIEEQCNYRKEEK